MTDKIRELFEAWAKDKEFEIEREKDINAYLSPVTKVLYTGYEAGYAACEAQQRTAIKELIYWAEMGLGCMSNEIVEKHLLAVIDNAKALVDLPKGDK